jgi:carbamoyltransferase
VYVRPDGLWTLQDMGVANDRIAWCPSHHLSHALHAHHAFSFCQSLVCVCDFAGNPGETNSVFLVDDDSYKRVRRDRGEAGIAAIYAAVTDLLGLDGATQAGHTMALAAYGKPLELPLVRTTADGWVASAAPHKLASYLVEIGQGELVESIGAGDFPSQAALAATIQAVLEQAVADILADAVERTGCRSVIIAGGVGTNCRLIGSLRGHFPTLNIRAPFAPGDTGQALGNAVWGLRMLGAPVPPRLRYPFLGPAPCRIDMSDARDHLADCHIVTDPLEALRQAVSLLDQGAIIALCEGRSEFGPRALGHRSLVCRADQPTLAHRLSAVIKLREWYRPFGCVVRKISGSTFMEATIAPSAQWPMYSGVLHADGTTRIQTLDGEHIPFTLHGLLSDFPVLLNTSLNQAGAPLIETALDSADFFLANNVDALFLNGCLITRVD